MTNQCLIWIYQKLLETKFSRLLLRIHTSPEDVKCIDVFGIPDGKSSEFVKFILDDLPVLLEKEKTPFYPVIPHSISATRKYYPDIYKQLKLRKEHQ